MALALTAENQFDIIIRGGPQTRAEAGRHYTMASAPVPSCLVPPMTNTPHLCHIGEDRDLDYELHYAQCGAAVLTCKEHADGSLWVDNDEYSSRVNSSGS
jgi:hypothetical protein